MGKIEKARNLRSGRPNSAVAEVAYDDAARREFLTGFHKRKLEKKKAAIEKWAEKAKEERRELRKENNKRHLILDDLERIEAVTQERAAATDKVKEKTVEVATIPSASTITTVTISDWNPEQEEEDEEEEKDEAHSGADNPAKPRLVVKAKPATARTAKKKPKGVSKVRTKANPHTKQAKEGKKAKQKDKRKRR
ncbi:hypothetical protein HDU87_005343 [Geranomyces variabilis]|uniref:Ribosomal RNA-processing protein 17 n=1 Tax=Geranomyces variabilis TaxID=109894 RepID=A0AAD5TIP1_9FUNG|nr:hypothetical protein HDU87_005343 [Geranomyces variabilis]